MSSPRRFQDNFQTALGKLLGRFWWIFGSTWPPLGLRTGANILTTWSQIDQHVDAFQDLFLIGFGWILWGRRRQLCSNINQQSIFTSETYLFKMFDFKEKQWFWRFWGSKSWLNSDQTYNTKWDQHGKASWFRLVRFFDGSQEVSWEEVEKKNTEPKSIQQGFKNMMKIWRALGGDLGASWTGLGRFLFFPAVHGTIRGNPVAESQRVPIRILQGLKIIFWPYKEHTELKGMKEFIRIWDYARHARPTRAAELRTGHRVESFFAAEWFVDMTNSFSSILGTSVFSCDLLRNADSARLLGGSTNQLGKMILPTNEGRE